MCNSHFTLDWRWWWKLGSITFRIYVILLAKSIQKYWGMFKSHNKPAHVKLTKDINRKLCHEDDIGTQCSISERAKTSWFCIISRFIDSAIYTVYLPKINKTKAIPSLVFHINIKSNTHQLNQVSLIEIKFATFLYII